MKKQLTLTTLVLSVTMIAGTSWAGPCKNGANPGLRVDCQEANLRGADLQEAFLGKARWVDGHLCKLESFTFCK